jgi:hypothetical protein
MSRPAGLAEPEYAMASKVIVRKDMWVRIPHPAPPCASVGGCLDAIEMGHFRSQATVDSALWLSDIGLRDADNAEIHGVALKTIRRWRREYQRRGNPRGQSHTSVPCPRCAGGQLDEAAYAELLGWYLGDGWLTEARRGVYLLTIVNDRRYTMLNAHFMDLIRAVKPAGRPISETGQVVSTHLQAGSTGRVCSRSTVQVSSTGARSCWSLGNATSWSGIQATSHAGCSSPTDAAP